MRTITTIVAAAVLGTAAHALPITGDAGFFGTGNLNSGNVGTATQMTVNSAVVNPLANGVYSTFLNLNDPITFTSPLVFGVTSGTIWTGGGLTFTALAPIQYFPNIPANTGSIVANGTVDDGPGGYDPTPVRFTLTVLPGTGAGRGFVALTQSIPDSGSMVGLMGLGMAALGLAAWRKNAR